MRDVAKSMLRFSWAMSLLGARQLAALADDEKDREGAGQRLRKTLDEISDSTVGELDGRFRSLYDAGVKMQDEMLEVMFDVLEPKAVVRATSRVMERAVDMVKELVPEDDEEADESA